MTTYAITEDLLQVDPTINDYGVIDFDVELTRSSNEINRLLKVRWFLNWAQHQANPGEFSAAKLDPTQWTQAVVYHALGYHICPKLSKFQSQGQEDNFQVKMDYYQGRFEHEMELCLREGVRYDADSSGTITVDETRSVNQLRLIR